MTYSDQYSDKARHDFIRQEMANKARQSRERMEKLFRKAGWMKQESEDA